MIELVIADDQSLIRMALRNLFNSEDDIHVAAEAENGQEAWDLVSRLRPDVAMLDIRMPGIDGLEVLRRISRDANLAATRVVMITTFEVDDYIFDALSNGAAGFVMKDASDVTRKRRPSGASKRVAAENVRGAASDVEDLPEKRPT